MRVSSVRVSHPLNTNIPAAKANPRAKEAVERDKPVHAEGRPRPERPDRPERPERPDRPERPARPERAVSDPLPPEPALQQGEYLLGSGALGQPNSQPSGGGESPAVRGKSEGKRRDGEAHAEPREGGLGRRLSTEA